MVHGHWMHRGRRGPTFEKGALKYLILDLFSSKPRHGYDIIRELEELSGGCYAPSPGVVYPTLQMLEDLGHIVAKKENGKKVYEITDEGREYLAAHADLIKQHRDHMTECFASAGSPEFASMMGTLKNLFELVHAAGRGGIDADKVEKIKDVLMRAGKDIDEIIGGGRDD